MQAVFSLLLMNARESMTPPVAELNDTTNTVIAMMAILLSVAVRIMRSPLCMLDMESIVYLKLLLF